MTHFPVLPVVVPLAVAAVMLIVPALKLQRLLALCSAIALVVLGAVLVARTSALGHEIYALGTWPAPFGIVLVADRAAALLVAVTSVVGLAASLAALGGWDTRGPYFHPLLQLQFAGLNGAFLTGDLFNLFVSFELLLIASFCLLLHGMGRERLRASLHYVVFNLAASAGFLLAAGLVYGALGTLNMADIASRLPDLGPEDQGLVRAAGLLLLAVFGAKAALFPLSFWLPGTYTAASAPVAALFAIMTKVGVYAIIRVHVLIFGNEAGELAGLAAPWLLPAALGALAVGVLGALSAERLSQMAAYLTLVSVGTMLVGVALLDREGLGGALYYLAHSSLALAALFLIVPLFSDVRGAVGDRLVLGPAPDRPVLLGLMLLLAAISLAGIPPLSGFFGKLLILQGARGHEAAWLIWFIVLASGLLVIIGLARAGSVLVWASERSGVAARRSSLAAYMPAALLIAASLGLALAAGPVTAYTTAAAEQLLEPRGYIDAVMKR